MFFNDVICAGSSENSICDLSNRKFRFHLLVCGHLVSSNDNDKKVSRYLSAMGINEASTPLRKIPVKSRAKETRRIPRNASILASCF